MKNLSLEGVFSDISFDLRKGEILGLAGLVGAGRTNVAETIFGVTPATSGEIVVNGKKLVVDSPLTAMHAGMAFLTEDRKDTGCFLVLSVLENMEIAVLMDRYVKNGFVSQASLNTECEKLKSALRIKTPNLDERIENLSGGNQQKALIGRWLLTRAEDPDSRRADARNRCRRKGGNPQADLQARRRGSCRHHDLFRNAGDSRHE